MVVATTAATTSVEVFVYLIWITPHHSRSPMATEFGPSPAAYLGLTNNGCVQEAAPAPVYDIRSVAISAAAVGT